MGCAFTTRRQATDEVVHRRPAKAPLIASAFSRHFSSAALEKGPRGSAGRFCLRPDAASPMRADEGADQFAFENSDLFMRLLAGRLWRGDCGRRCPLYANAARHQYGLAGVVAG